MAKLAGLKLKQLSMALQEGRAIPVEKLGQRLRGIRETLGLTQKQLAKRIRISQPLLSRIEENTANCTLKTIVKVARALEGDFLGVVAVRNSLESMIRRQAETKAKNILKRTYANMAMEEQQPGKKEYDYQLNKMIAELTANPGPELWSE